MSVAGISSSSMYSMQQLQQEFQKLGQDLQSGNLAAAQTDFVTLQQSGPQASSAASSQSNSPIAQEFNQLAKDLQSGNLSAAQQDYTTLQQDFQNQATKGHHHHHHGGGGEASAISQEMQQLGQALQSGNLTSAQQAYSTLQQDFQQAGQGNGQQSQSSSGSLSVTA
jgi:hypothetical protein